MHTAERLRIILNSREDASLANIICSYISHQSSPLLINIIFHQLQPVGNAAESKHCHWLLDYEHLLLPFCSWISNEIQWREKKTLNKIDHLPSQSLPAWGGERGFLLCFAVCLWLLSCRRSAIQWAEMAGRLIVFLCPLMTRQCVSFRICISFCLSPKSSSFQRNQHCLITVLC